MSVYGRAIQREGFGVFLKGLRVQRHSGAFSRICRGNPNAVTVHRKISSPGAAKAVCQPPAWPSGISVAGRIYTVPGGAAAGKDASEAALPLRFSCAPVWAFPSKAEDSAVSLWDAGAPAPGRRYGRLFMPPSPLLHRIDVTPVLSGRSAQYPAGRDRTAKTVSAP